MLLHLKVTNKPAGQGPRLFIHLDSGVVLAEDTTDKSITHINVYGVNYVVDTGLDATAQTLNLELDDEPPQPAASSTEAAQKGEPAAAATA